MKLIGDEMAPSAGRKCLIVLGMHRSGTSALTGALGILGATLPKELLGGHPSNPKGHFESLRILELNEQLMAALNTNWYDVRSIELCNLDSTILDQFRTKLIEALHSEFSNTALFALKDPRISRLLPLTISAFEDFGASIHAVICVRNPLEVAQSLWTRDGIAQSHALALWLRYMLEAELYSRGLPRVFVEFSDLLTDWRSVILKIEQRLGIALPGYRSSAALVDRFLDKSLRHQVASLKPQDIVGDDSPVWTSYRALSDLAREQDNAGSVNKLNQIRATSDKAANFLGQAVHEYYSEFSVLRPRLAAAEDRAGELERIFEHLGTKIAALKQKIREQTERNKRQHKKSTSKINKLKKDKLKLRQDKREMLSSSSWRLTAPLRRIRSHFEKLGL